MAGVDVQQERHGDAGGDAASDSGRAASTESSATVSPPRRERVDGEVDLARADRLVRPQQVGDALARAAGAPRPAWSR